MNVFDENIVVNCSKGDVFWLLWCTYFWSVLKSVSLSLKISALSNSNGSELRKISSVLRLPMLNISRYSQYYFLFLDAALPVQEHEYIYEPKNIGPCWKYMHKKIDNFSSSSTLHNL